MSKYETYPFTNISNDIWKDSFDKEEYIFQPHETKFLPMFVVNGFVNSWLDWAVNSEEFGVKIKGKFDKPQFLSKKKGDLEVQLRSPDYKIVSLEDLSGLQKPKKEDKKVEK